MMNFKILNTAGIFALASIFSACTDENHAGVLTETGIVGNVHALKVFFCICCVVVIGRNHVGCHGFAKASGAADADKTLCCSENTVEISNQAAFIHIDFRLAIHKKFVISGIQIYAHGSFPL